MKLKALLFALVLFGMGACTQRTCPTYSNLDVEKQEVNTVQNTSERV